jgi:hypothetical protein
MKKMILLFVVFTTNFILTGCQLATENTVTPNLDNEDVYEVPYALDVDIPSLMNVDLSEYFHLGFDCDGVVKKDYTCSSYSKSIFGTFGLHVHDNIVNEVRESSKYTYNFEATYYFGRALEGEMILFETLYWDMETGESTKYNASHAMLIGSGTGISFMREGTYPDGTLAEINFDINLVVIDELESVTFKEYNDDNLLLNTTVITKDTTLESITINSDATFVIVEEQYLDEDGETFTERDLLYENDFYDIYFLNDIGLAELSVIEIIFE